MGEKMYELGTQLPGTQYTLISRLGGGGYGDVFVAEHSFTEARVALKILQVDLATSDAARRFHIEAKTLAKLVHTNIVAAFDGGWTNEPIPRPFIVMELLKGMALDAILRRCPHGLSVKEATNIVAQALEGLSAAHAAGIIHRDIKPANIFLHRLPSGETVTKVLDFGVAHLLSSQRTTGARFLGTFRWAAPEQLLGHRPTPQTDIYSAGWVLYYCLCGKSPFGDLQDSHAIGRAHLHKRPAALSSLVEGIPEDLERLVMSMLSKSPEDRPKSAEYVSGLLKEIREKADLHLDSNKTDPSPADAETMCAVEGPSPTSLDSPSSLRLVAAARFERTYTPERLPNETEEVKGVAFTAPLHAPAPLTSETASKESIDRFAPTGSLRSEVRFPRTNTVPITPQVAEDNVYVDPELLFPQIVASVTRPASAMPSFAAIYYRPKKRSLQSFIAPVLLVVMLMLGLIGIFFVKV